MVPDIVNKKIVNRLYDDANWSFTSFFSTMEDISSFIDIAEDINFILNSNKIKYRDLSVLGSCEEHSVNVGILNGLIGRYLNVPNIKDLILGGLLHDIGKYFVPNNILNKAGTLTLDERLIMNQHADIGHYIIKDIIKNDNVSSIIRNHHNIKIEISKDVLEGKVEDEKELYSHICAISDIVDAMFSFRPYKSPLTIDEVKRELKIKGFWGIEMLFKYIL